MTEKRFLEDISNEDLLKKLRRANAGMTEAISEEILFRGVIVRDNNDPKIQYPDPLPKSGVGFKKIWDEAGVFPSSEQFTHYWDVVKKPVSQEEFQAEVEKAAKYFKLANIVEPSEDAKKRIEDLKNLKFGDKLDRTQPHWAFLNKSE